MSLKPIDDVAWTEHVSWLRTGSYRSLSYGFRLRTNSRFVDNMLSYYLAGFSVPSGYGGPLYSLVRSPGRRDLFLAYLNERLVQRTADPHPLVDYVLGDVTRKAIESTADHLILHAGAVSWRGLATLLPAAPDSGKTTTVAGLVRAGFSYLSDEAALIDPTTGWVHPYPRALWMEPRTFDLFPNLRRDMPQEFVRPARGRYHVRADDLRRESVGGPCPVGFVVAPQYAEGARTRLEPMSPAQALVHLADCAFNLTLFGHDGFNALVQLSRTCQAYRLVIGDLESAVRLVRDVVVD